MSEWSTEDLRKWKDDPAGRPFWEALQQRFADGISYMRRAVEKGDLHEATKHATQVAAAEEILQLVDVLIDEKVQESKDREAK